MHLTRRIGKGRGEIFEGRRKRREEFAERAAEKEEEKLKVRRKKSARDKAAKIVNIAVAAATPREYVARGAKGSSGRDG